MNKTEDLKDFLKKDPNRIIKVLEASNFHNITFRASSNEIRCSKYEDSNMNGVIVYCDSLFGTIYSTGITGDIFSLIMSHNNISFYDSIHLVESVFGIGDFFYKQTEPIFGGIYSKYKNKNSDLEYQQDDSDPEFNISILDNYKRIPSVMFMEDGIDYTTQKIFNICYSEISSRICVPWFNTNGKIVGIEGRLNQKEVPENVAKWLPVLNFRKKRFLYGLYENMDFIRNSDEIYIFESTKSILKCYSRGIRNCIACGGNDISLKQVETIMELPVKNVVICFDEDISSLHMIKQCEKFSKSIFYKKDAYYIYDEKKEYLKYNSKNSPIDVGAENFQNLLDNCTIKYNKE